MKDSTSFYSQEEILKLGFKSVGKNVLISRKVSFYSPELISIGEHVRIDDFCILSGHIILGNYIHIAAYVALFGGMGIEIKDFCGVSSRSAIYSATDDYSGDFLPTPCVPDEMRHVTGGKVTLEKYVIIGSGATVFPAVTIGEGCAVGAMSLVTSSLKEWGIYAGIPVKRLKERSRKLLHFAEILSVNEGGTYGI